MLNDLLVDTGFARKRIGQLKRKENECQQFFTFYFSRERFSNCYSLTSSLVFSFPEVDRLTIQFLGKEYDKRLVTGAEPFYRVVPDSPVWKYKYSLDETLYPLAEMVAKDFCAYALPFYEKYNSLNKLEDYFDRLLRGEIKMEFRIVNTDKQGKGSGCCIAAVLCILEKWDELRLFLEELKETDWLLDENRERINEYIPIL